MSLYSKALTGLGAAFILVGAVWLWKDWGIWGYHIYLILMGMLFILDGISPILGGRDGKVIRGLRFGVGGVAIVFIVVGLATSLRS